MVGDRSPSETFPEGNERSARFRERLGRRSFPWIVVAALVVAAAPLGFLAKLVTADLYSDNPPPCFGLGWGCSFSPDDVGVLMAIFWLIGVASIAGLLLITEFFWRRVAVARSVATFVLAAVTLVSWAIFGIWAFP